MVEVLVASALMAVALVVLLGSLSSLLLGSRVAERRTVEERLARTQIERLMAQDPQSCPPEATQSVDGIAYKIKTTCPQGLGYLELTVTVMDPAGRSESLSIDRVLP